LPDYEARAVPDSQLIEIRVVDISPARAQAVANELANQLISSSPTNPKPEEIERQRFVEQQLLILRNRFPII
jgi:capsular polysaccharide biosynthesis protein